MEAKQLVKLEKNEKFRRKIASIGIWRNYAFVPPIIIIFGSIFGLLYLLNNDLLISFYAIPFAILFLIATLWFKSVRKYLINKKISSQDFFQICIGYPLFNNKNSTIILFTTNNYRHSTNFLEKQKKDILSDDNLNNKLRNSDINMLEILEIEDIKNTYLSCIPKTKESEIYILYTNQKNIIKINNKSFKRFS